MNKLIVLGLSLLVMLISCNKDDSTDAETTNFTTTVVDVDYESANITWSNPFSTPGTLYTITLNGSQVATGISATTYFFTDLLEDTNYQGEIIAKNGADELRATFSFQTDVFNLLTFNGDVELRSQQEVNEFGANGYQKITGYLEINGKDSSITDLSPLIDLIEVGENASVINTDITSVAGLNNLKKVGNLGFANNNMLINLNELESINSIERDLVITWHEKLNNIDAVSQIPNFDGQLNVVGINELTSVNMFNNHPSIEGISFQYNPKLTSISGFQNTISVDYLGFWENDFVTFSLPTLEIISGDFRIYNNENLINFSLPKIQSIKTISFTDNQSLTDFNGISQLTNLEYLFVSSNSSLLNIDGLSNINSLKGLHLSGNISLLNIEGLMNLEIISTERLQITENHKLKSLNGLQNLTAIALDCRILRNKDLTDLCAITELVINNGISGELEIIQNAYNPTFQDFIDGNCSL